MPNCRESCIRKFWMAKPWWILERMSWHWSQYFRREYITSNIFEFCILTMIHQMIQLIDYRSVFLGRFHRHNMKSVRQPPAVVTGSVPITFRSYQTVATLVISRIYKVNPGGHSATSDNSLLNPRTTKLFRTTFATKGGCCNPHGFWSSRPNFLVKLFVGMFSGSRIQWW